MSTIKEQVLLSNSFSVGFKSVLAQADMASLNFDDTPINPTSAFAELWNVSAAAYIDMGDLGPNSVGAAATVSGNEVTFTLGKTVITVAGDYVLVVTAVYADGKEVSQRRPFKVKERR